MRYPARVLDDAQADVLMAELESSAENAQLRERAARALAKAGRHAESIAVLRAKLAHFNAHEPGSLPCLCRRCLNAEEWTTTWRDTEFTRLFTVARGRVLFFWLPEDLRDQEALVRSSVNAGLRARLRGRDQ